MNEYKILIVDDNRDLADCMALLLQQEGYSATAVHTGEDAVARVLVEQFDLAILDVRLPGMDGVEVFQAIRQLRPELAGIMITAHRVNNSLQKLCDQGLVNVYRKPFSMETILNRISELCQERYGMLTALSA